MIRYTLRCDHGHRFDSWFQSASAFDSLSGSGHVACAACGSTSVEKAPMAPRLNGGSDEPAPQTEATRPLSAPASDAERALAALRDHVERTSDYVGRDFARKAREMHAGDGPRRAIWGEARGEEAKALIEDGVPIAPLPFMPSRKTN